MTIKIKWRAFINTVNVTWQTLIATEIRYLCNTVPLTYFELGLTTGDL